MPIRRGYRFFYPIDSPQLSTGIRFGRTKGRCEACARPGWRTVFCLGDGRWWDEEAASWRDGAGQIVCLAAGVDDLLRAARTKRMALATAHRNHDTADNSPTNLAAFCQRCHMVHDWAEHQRRWWRALFRRTALGDLFRGPDSWLKAIGSSRAPTAGQANLPGSALQRCRQNTRASHNF